MPGIRSRGISVAVDMRGCPNRCRHCYVGHAPNRRLAEDDLRWVAHEFRSCTRPGETRPFFDSLRVVSWTREPDFGDDYRRLYDLEQELSDRSTYRREWELLSIWRLARDPAYAEWARQIGPPKCQISFFGLAESNDWFCQRPGAFGDCLAATECLLAVGIFPRWQLFLTRRLLPELGELLALVHRMRLEERCRQLGGRFELFLHTPSPDGEARAIEHLRPTAEETRVIPQELIERSQKHLGVERLWHAEAELVAEVLAGEEGLPGAYPYPEPLFFTVGSDWSVGTNMGTGEPWWRLGNLREETLSEIIGRFEADVPLGYRAISSASVKELARRYGDPQSRLVYDARADLEGLWVAQQCEEAYGGSR